MSDLWEEQIKFNREQVSNWNKQIEIDENLLHSIRQTRRLVMFLIGTFIGSVIVLVFRLVA
jgi:hypothetical protein